MPFSQAFVLSITDSSKSMLNIAAFVVFFASVISLFIYSGIIPSLSKLLSCIFSFAGLNINIYNKMLCGFFEVSNGCAAAAQIRGMLSLLLISAALSWSGLSVQCQIVSIVKSAGLSTRYYIYTRVFHILLSLGLTWLLFNLFPAYIPTFASNSMPLVASIHSAPGCVALLLITGMLLLSQLKV